MMPTKLFWRNELKLSELKSIIMECIEELNESGPADRYRKKHGKIQDQGTDRLSTMKPGEYQTRKTRTRNSPEKNIVFDLTPPMHPKNIGILTSRSRRGSFKRIGKMGDRKQ